MSNTVQKDQLMQRWQSGEFVVEKEFRAERTQVPGRPDKPELVHPRDVPRRGLGTPAGKAAFYHAIAHIEFNAINLGLDAVYRFAHQMPDQYTTDWLQVAADEARHFCMLAEHLATLDGGYGDSLAHNNLWEMALRTDHDVMVRMALVPRVLEARGLDVAPGMIDKLKHLGDPRGAEILEVILREEVEHVSVGNRWYLSECESRGLDPKTTFRELLLEHTRGFLSGPFNEKYRKQAGFTDAELEDLRELEAQFAEELK